MYKTIAVPFLSLDALTEGTSTGSKKNGRGGAGAGLGELNGGVAVIYTKNNENSYIFRDEGQIKHNGNGLKHERCKRFTKSKKNP